MIAELKKRSILCTKFVSVANLSFPNPTGIAQTDCDPVLISRYIHSACESGNFGYYSSVIYSPYQKTRSQNWHSNPGHSGGIYCDPLIHSQIGTMTDCFTLDVIETGPARGDGLLELRFQWIIAGKVNPPFGQERGTLWRLKHEEAPGKWLLKTFGPKTVPDEKYYEPAYIWQKTRDGEIIFTHPEYAL